jgi:quinoprotein dehydrogenase-associated probable ABC transporter substrate-binding protein
MGRAFQLAVVVGFLVCAGETAAKDRELRVCADPNNLPFSNQRLEGFENEIAQLVAKDLRATVTYTWRPQRRGFVRRTLKAGKCDLVLGVPSDYDLVLATRPYYRSTYVFVYARSKHLQLRSFDDPVLRKLKIGLHAFAEGGANAPPAHALARRGIVDNVVGFAMWGEDSVESPAGRIIDAVAAGEIDVAIVWGPFAGYFARRQRAALEVVPVSPALDPPSLPFVYDISIGVRKGENAFKKELDGILDRRRADIQGILKRYRVPIVGMTPRASPEVARRSTQ